MKKLNLIALSMTCLFASTASAAEGGFQGPSQVNIIRDVQAAQQAKDDAQVELTGHILSALKDERYIFRDTTGEITVEIDNELWRGNTVTPETNVMIRGEIDKDWSEKTVDVKSIDIVR